MVDEEVNDIIGRECIGKQGCNLRNQDLCKIARENARRRHRKKQTQVVELGSAKIQVEIEYENIFSSIVKE